jgi:hypothetical protein
MWGENDVLKAFEFDPATGHFLKAPAVSGQQVAADGMPGGMLSLSSNGANDAIIWALLPFDDGTGSSTDSNATRLVPGILRAFNATTLDQIWTSQDRPGN